MKMWQMERVVWPENVEERKRTPTSTTGGTVVAGNDEGGQQPMSNHIDDSLGSSMFRRQVGDRKWRTASARPQTGQQSPSQIPGSSEALVFAIHEPFEQMPISTTPTFFVFLIWLKGKWQNKNGTLSTINSTICLRYLTHLVQNVRLNKITII